MRSTSSGVSSRRCRADSIILRAMSAARSTNSSGPVMLSVSPRSATFTPPILDSSTRLPSLTPASVSRSAPSVFRRCVVLPSLTYSLLDPDVKLNQVLVWHWRRRSLEERPRRGRFREGDHVAQRRRPRQLHRYAVESERDAAVRRCSGPEPLQQEAEARVRRRLVDSEQAEHPCLQRG